MDTATIVNLLGVVSGNRQNSPGPINEGPRRGGWDKKDDSKSWSKSRGHKSHGKKHGK